MITQKHDLDVTPSGVLPVVNASQYDVGRIIKFYLYNESEVYNIPVGTSVLVNGIKPNGDAFSYSATYTDNVVTVTLTDQMTVIDGEVKCELRFADALGNDIGTTNFILLVEKAPFDASIPISETEIPAIIELARAEQYNAEAWAVGERNGTPVDPTDPTYHNNAKYWSENAQHGSLDNLSDVVISSPLGGQALVYDDVNDEWVNDNVSTVDNLDDLTDVSLASPTNGQVLTFNNNEWKNEDIPSIGVDDLDDSSITSLADKDILRYNSTSQKWENSADLTSAESDIQTLHSGWQKNGAYNLLPNDAITQIVSGITVTVNSDKSVSIVTTGTNSQQNIIVVDRLLARLKLSAGKYKIVGCPSGGSAATYSVIFVTSNGIVGRDTGDGDVVTLDGQYDVGVAITIAANQTLNLTFKPMITTDLNATYDDYVPYAKTNRELTEYATTKVGSLSASQYTTSAENVRVRQVGNSVHIWGFCNNNIQHSDGSNNNVLGTITGVTLPKTDEAVRTVCGIAAHAYDVPQQVGYLSLATNGELIFKTTQTGTKSVYFDISYAV